VHAAARLSAIDASSGAAELQKGRVADVAPAFA